MGGHHSAKLERLLQLRQLHPPAPVRKAVIAALAGTASIGVASSAAVGAPIAAAIAVRADRSSP